MVIVTVSIGTMGLRHEFENPRYVGLAQFEPSIWPIPRLDRPTVDKCVWFFCTSYADASVYEGAR